MSREDVLSIYDERYAATYDGGFLLGEWYREATAYELSLLREWLQPGDRWLDVACGTGFHLGQFPEIDRCGLDLSPAMLAHARRANPGVPFVEGDYCQPRDEWRDRWDLVTSMWWAYCYAGSVRRIEALIRNLADWTSPRGTCFFPIVDPEVLCRTTIGRDQGGTTITAVIWEWTDARCGTRHENLIAPHVDHLLDHFRARFDLVHVLDYPAFAADAVGGVRRAIVASAKRT